MRNLNDLKREMDELLGLIAKKRDILKQNYTQYVSGDKTEKREGYEEYLNEIEQLENRVEELDELIYLAQNNNTFDGLPDMCFAVIPSTKELVMVKRGVMGYFPQKPENAPWDAENMDYLNERMGVTKGQATAMANGSMHGWNTPASNPANFDDEGNWIKK